MRNIIRAAVIGGVLFHSPSGAAAYDATAIVTSEAKRQGVPVDFALRMARIESGVQCNKHSKISTASGPLQILVPTARSLGYRGNIRKASCSVQAHYGMKHLAICYRGAHGNRALAKKCHQVGVSVLYGRKHGSRKRSHSRPLGRKMR